MPWQEGIEEQETRTDDDGAVGDIEVGPVVAEDVDFNEVDDRAVDDAIVQVAESATKNEGEGNRGDVDSAAEADEGNQNCEGRNSGKGDQAPADGVGRGRVGEEREGRAFVEPVRDPQEAGDHGDGIAHENVLRNKGLRDPVGNDDDGGDEEKPRESAGSGKAHLASQNRE